ncbi:hypothetical protein PQR02_34410 [Paraburkholderia sediminicola]|uniref:Uncharacterized protein n=1 Tax=Paraburkholderia rhynchosiae TaxID=487049 RepID=A0ACC7NMJ5_9BURK
MSGEARAPRFNPTLIEMLRQDFELELGIQDTFCPLPADSSQLSAVVAGSKGKDFVLIGPPGIGRVVAGHDLPVLQLSWPSARVHDSVAMRTLRETAELLDVHAKVMGEGQLTSSPLAHVVQTEWSPLWQASLLDSARAIGSVVARFEAATTQLSAAVGLPSPVLDARVREGLRLLAATLPSASGHDWQFVLRPDAKTIADNLRVAKPLVERHRELHASLSAPRGNQVLEDVRQGIVQLTRYHELRSQLSQPWNESLPWLV